MPQNVTNAALYGSGIFTTIAVFDGKPFLWEKHWSRLADNAQKTGIGLGPHTEETTRKALEDQLALTGDTDARVRITFFDKRSSELWPAAENCDPGTSLSILVGKRRPARQKFSLTVSPYPSNSGSPLAGVKSCNYLENIIALREARGRGFDEAIRLNERGEIASGVMANVFWLKKGNLHTPSLKTGCLPGTTREFVLENLECREVDADVDELMNAESIFLTSAGLEIVQITRLEKREFPGVLHPILQIIPPNRLT